ncbi:unnamed protein product [Dovyalis caffra]|uniref:Uncharacterized protein n=1 Tax=Dovyalis caffra TaxID=77055 RepID=A0AAV1SVC1_9ROSI|nr:unnamed protein product [Dovyalis caffra]
MHVINSLGSIRGLGLDLKASARTSKVLNGIAWVDEILRRWKTCEVFNSDEMYLSNFTPFKNMDYSTTQRMGKRSLRSSNSRSLTLYSVPARQVSTTMSRRLLSCYLVSTGWQTVEVALYAGLFGRTDIYR